MTMFLSVKALHEEGHSKKSIARKLSLDVRTVRKQIRRILAGATEPRREDVPQKLDVYGERIEAWVKQDLSATQIYQKLLGIEGFAASYATVRRLVRELRPKEVEAYCRMSYRPGEEAQVDFADIGRVEVGGQQRKAYLFVMTLCYSRCSYYELVLNQTVPTFLGAIRRAFEFFGGVPERIKPDNLRAAVLINRLGERYYQEDFFRLCRHYGTIPDAARPFTPTDKGRVERDIRYAQGNHFRGRKPGSFIDEQAALFAWRDSIANVRVHGTTGRRPIDLLAEERAHLKPLPAEAYEVGQLGLYRVRKDCHVQVLGNYYSAPYRLVGERVLVRLTETGVEVLAAGGRVARHDRLAGKGQSATDPSHYPPSKRIASQEVHRRRLLAVRAAGPSASEYLGGLRKSRFVLGGQLGRLHRLLGAHGPTALDAACRRAIVFGATDGARIVERILERGLDRRPIPAWPREAPDGLKQGEDYGRPLAEYAALLSDKEVG